MESYLPMLTPIIGLIGAVLLALISVKTKSKRIADILSLSTITLILILSSLIAFKVLSSNKPLVYGAGGWIPPLGIVYVVDGLSAIMGLITSITTLLVAIYCIGYFRNGDRGLYYLYVLILLLLSALLGVYYTGDLFNFFVMIELMAVTAYALVAYHRNKGEAIEASLKYGMIACLAGLLLFISIGFIYAYMGTVSIPDIAAKVLGIHTSMDLFSGRIIVKTFPLLFIAGLIVWSLMIESAVFPLHFWLPDAHSEAPSPVSALLSGLVVNAGLYGLIRLFYTALPIRSQLVGDVSVLLDILVVLGCIGAIYASIMMYVEQDIKRIIAYSTVMHVSFIVLGLSMGTQYALSASIYHFITHSFSKALAFLSVGIVIASTGVRNINEFKGFSKLYPGVSAGIIISMLGLAGMPPIGTFPSKLLLILASIQSGNLFVTATIIVASSIAAITYFKIIHILINEPAVKTAKYKIGLSAKTSILVLSIIVLLVGIALPVISQYTSSIAENIVDPRNYIGAVEDLFSKYGLTP